MSMADNNMNETSYIKVRDQIREDILMGIFEPDVRVKISELSKKYGVSQMPVREALQQLQGEGLVNLIPQKGARVRKIDERFLNNMYDIRHAIETMLVTHSIDNLTDRDIKSIQNIQEEYEACVIQDDLEAILKTNERFHRVINELAENAEAVDIINRQWLLIDSLRRKFGFSKERMQETIQDHRLIVKALTLRDRSLAEKASSKHVMNAKEDLIIRFNENLK
jgi:DNA-binding GntR family transcriptional regulator